MVVNAIRNAKGRKKKATTAKVGAKLVAAVAANDPAYGPSLIEKDGIGPRGKTGKITHRIRDGIDFFSCSDLAAKQVAQLFDDVVAVYSIDRKRPVIKLIETKVDHRHSLTLEVYQNGGKVAVVCMVTGIAYGSYQKRSINIMRAIPDGWCDA